MSNTPTSTQNLRTARRFGPVGVSTGPEIPQVPTNYYRATVKDVQETTSTYNDTTRDQYVVEFELLDFKKPDGKEVTLRGYIAIPPTLISSGELNENSKLYEFLLAIGYEPDNIEIEPTAWQGAELRINVVNKKTESGKNAGQVRPKIDGYLRVDEPQAPATIAPPAPPPAAPRASIPPRRPAATQPTPAATEDGNSF